MHNIIPGRTETVVKKRKLTKLEVKRYEGEVKAAHEEARKVKARFKEVADYIKPKVQLATDPQGSKKKGVPFEEARALNDELIRLKKLKGADLAVLKAKARAAFDAAANGFVYDIIECDVALDDSGTQALLIDDDGNIIDQRAATAEERQLSLPDDEHPEVDTAEAAQ